MSSDLSVLAIIPARSGSKGIPRKNLRSLGGKPLICHSIETLKKSKKISKIIVSTNSEEIEYISELLGVDTIRRPDHLASDSVSLDPVIKHAVEELKNQGEFYNIILTVQPTSPFLKSESINSAISLFSNPKINSVISTVKDNHLRWHYDDNNATPLYKKRVNRQLLPNEYKETGGVIAVRSEIFSETRIVEPVQIIELDDIEGIDIDTPEDLMFSESLFKRKKIALWPCGTIEKGMGHIYRQLLVADHLVSHDLTFCMTKEDSIGLKKVADSFYNYNLSESSDDLINWIIENNFDVAVLDILDTSFETVSKLKAKGIKVITFEDLGEGAKIADLNINALYNLKGHAEDKSFFGPNYFLVRPDFSIIEKKNHDFSDITILFGGTDPNNISLLALSEIVNLSLEARINLIIGPANKNSSLLKDFVKKNKLNNRVNIIENTHKVSKFLSESKVVICSGGQTLYESISVGVPAIVISQNQRELTHGLLEQNFKGIVNLNEYKSYKGDSIKKYVKQIFDDKRYYNNLVKECKNLQLAEGTKRVMDLINNLLSRETE
mgnify:CR=1 FL=1|tara:strand:+ start:7080 stop:8735 length:1656 start_codon:yes stop_codon:yes gene_type:complete